MSLIRAGTASNVAGGVVDASEIRVGGTTDLLVAAASALAAAGLGVYLARLGEILDRREP